MAEVESNTRRTMDEDQERILTLKINLEGPAEFVSWMRERSRPRLGLFRIFPSGFRKHMRAARREQMLAMRSLIDAAIDRMLPEEEEEEKPARKAVEVEVE